MIVNTGPRSVLKDPDGAALQERITSMTRESIPSIRADCVPADDLIDPAPATTFSPLDATVVLEIRLPGGAP